MTYGILNVLDRYSRPAMVQIYGLARFIGCLLLLLFSCSTVLATNFDYRSSKHKIEGKIIFDTNGASTAFYCPVVGLQAEKVTISEYDIATSLVEQELLLQDTMPPLTILRRDSLSNLRDSFPDPPKIIGNTRQFKLSKDSLDASVAYEARDSQHIDFIKEEIHLFGDAKVSYEEVELTAGHIILNWGTNIATAEPIRDSLGHVVGLPAFSDGGQEFTAKRLRYNFRTSKGIITDAVTTQDDVIVRGGTSKFIRGAAFLKDSTKADVIYTEGGIFTSCTEDHPHFGFRTSKAKVIPNKLAVIGPSNLEIMGVPTPLWLPFGFFPLKSGRTTGLVFPGDYEYSPQWGYGLRDFGWFFPIGEHLNLTLLGNYYLKGTYGLGATGSYRKRYKYSGNFTLNYNKQRREDFSDGSVFFDPSLIISWSHRQDPAAHPTASFNGSINFQTNRAQSRVYNTATAVSQNVINSNVNFTKRWDGKPYTLSASLSHTQSNRTRKITVNFPQVRFQTQTIYPFRRPADKQVGKERWYELINFRYRNELKGTFTNSDTTFFTRQTLDDGRYGFRHDASTGLSFKVLKYFTLAPTLSYEETFYTRRRDYRNDFTTGLVIDTTYDENGIVIDTSDFGTINESLQTGLYSFREFSAGVRLNTQFFGTVKFRKGPLRGLRHIVKPSISFGYQPDYINNSNYYSLLKDTTELNDLYLNRFPGEIFGGPPRSGRQLGISYGIDNLFEAKIWNKRDSTTENVKLFQNISISGNYNFVDSLKWSPIRVRGGTRFFKGLTSLNLNAVFDPYEHIYIDGVSGARGKRVNITTLQASQKLVKLREFSGTISTNITVAKIRQLFQGEEEKVVTDVREERRQRREKEQELFKETDLLSLFENFSIRHNFNFRTERLVDQSGTGARDTLRFRTMAHSIELRGRVQLTENWNVDIGSIGYDFVAKNITYPYLSLARDLHCWEMRFSWAPTIGTYNFSIGVKPGTFDFLNLPYRQNRLDAEQLGGNVF